MFLFVSKVAGVLLTVSNLLVVVVLVGAIARARGWRRLGATFLWTGIAGLVLIGFGPVGAILMRPLEDRFPRPSDSANEPTGIIVLGGVIGSPSAPRRAIALTQDGERLTEAAALAHRYPNAVLVFSGMSFGDSADTASEPMIAKQFFMDMGVAEARIVLESRSLSTAQNAAYTRDLLMPTAGQRWFLVTSASHMPRAVGSFRHAGFPVIPYPVGYTTSGLPGDYWGIRLEVSTNLARADIAIHEWIGLAVYWLTGRTDAFWPAPEPAEL